MTLKEKLQAVLDEYVSKASTGHPQYLKELLEFDNAFIKFYDNIYTEDTFEGFVDDIFEDLRTNIF